MTLSDLHAFQRFMKMCAGRVGHVLNLASLGNDCGITHNTAKSWLSILEASYIVYLLKPSYKNFNKRIIKMPKLHFYDTGLVCSLLGIQNKANLNFHYLKGNLFESFVLSEIMKYRFNKGQEHDCYFWRDKTGNEIDCIAEVSERLIKIEIKSAKTIADDFFSGFKYWNKTTGEKGKNSFLIYNGDENQRRTLADVISWKNSTSVFANFA